jgi:hypothetical protein
MRIRFTLILLCALGLGACTQFYTNSKVDYELVSQQEDILNQIQSAPTRFTLALEENDAAWARANYFLRTYGGKAQIEKEAFQDKDVLTKNGTSGFRYQIIRQFANSKVTYQVLCTPKSSKRTTTEALLNAKNLARFLKDGELEVAQLIGG